MLQPHPMFRLSQCAAHCDVQYRDQDGESRIERNRRYHRLVRGNKFYRLRPELRDWQQRLSGRRGRCVIGSNDSPGGVVYLYYRTPTFDHTTQRVTALSRTPDHVDLFVIGFDDAVWSTWWDAEHGWQPW